LEANPMMLSSQVASYGWISTPSCSECGFDLGCCIGTSMPLYLYIFIFAGDSRQLLVRPHPEMIVAGGCQMDYATFEFVERRDVSGVQGTCALASRGCASLWRGREINHSARRHPRRARKDRYASGVMSRI